MSDQFRQGGNFGGGSDASSGGRGSRRAGYLKTDKDGGLYVDYKAVDDLRRTMTPNGKIYSRKRLGTTAREQRMLANAVKRARYLALLPYTDATL